jgi:hypothetical protein
MVKLRKVPNGTFKPMPPFKTYEEEANWWDKQNFSELMTNNAVMTSGRKNKTKPVSVRLEQDDYAQLEREAARQGIGPSTLLRMWARERLHPN